MATILALEKLYDDVVARFTADGLPALAAANKFGWREPPKQGGANTRIEWVPGDPTGNAGAVGPAKWPGRTTTYATGEPTGRPLATLHELFTVYVHGWDSTAPLSERAQYKATRLVYDAWVRAVYLAAHGTFAIKSTSWLIEKNEKRFGATLRVVGTIESMIPDSPPTFAPPDISAELSLTEEGETEIIEVETV